MRNLVLPCLLALSCSSGLPPARGDLSVSGANSTLAGTPQTVTLAAGATGFSGTIRIRSTDLAASVQMDTALSLQPSATWAFTVALKTAGFQVVSVEDAVTARQLAVLPVDVIAGPASRLQLAAAPVQGNCPPFRLDVSAVDAFGNVDPTYAGALELAPGPTYQLTPGDAGHHTFELDATAADARTVVVTATGGLSASVDLVTHGWCPAGPVSAEVMALAVSPVSPQTLYAATVGGIFRSTDGGNTWAGLNDGFSGDQFGLAIAAAPGNSGNVYAGLASGLYVLHPGSATWTRAAAPISPYSEATAIAIDPRQPGTVLVGTGGGVNGRGILRTTDGGTTWATVNYALPATTTGVGALAFEPGSSTVYAGVGGTVYRSDDKGTTWTATAGSWASAVGALAVAINGQVYAGGNGLDCVLKSSDRGATWSTCAPGSPRSILNLVTQGNATVYAAGGSGGWLSTDYGLSWKKLPLDSLGALTPSPDGSLYAGTHDQGVLKSTDSGATWMPSSDGMEAALVFSLASVPGSRRVYAGTRGGLFISDDLGNTWTRSQTASTSDFEAIAIDPVTPSTLYAADQGLLKSTDSGASWTNVAAGISGVVRTIAIDPAAPSTLYAGLQDGIYKSTDGATSWASAGLAGLWVSAIAFDPAAPAVVYANTSGGFFRSADRGGTWTQVGSGLPVVLDPHPVLVEPDSSIYVGGNAGVYRSTDGGNTFTAITSGSTSIYTLSLAFDAARSTLYAGGSQTVQKTSDGGKTWQVVAQGFPLSPQIFALLVKPGPVPMVYAGTYGMSVYRTWTGGE